MPGQSFVGIIPISTATDAWYRTFESLSLALTAAGIPKTADTGQVVWSTVTLPVAAALVNYEIRYFNDPLNATSPFYMKIFYVHSNIAAVPTPTLRFIVGTGSDGAGNITGAIPVTGDALNFQVGIQRASTATFRLVSDGSGFAILACDNSSGACRQWMFLERLRAADGTSISQQFAFFTNGGGALQSASNTNGFRGALIDSNPAAPVMFPMRNIPVTYWKELTQITDSLVMGDNYPFAVPIFPTRLGEGRTKLMLGGSQVDFNNGVLVTVPRFTSASPYKYYVDLFSTSLGHCFGAVAAAANAAPSSSTTPALFSFPLLYWE